MNISEYKPFIIENEACLDKKTECLLSDHNFQTPVICFEAENKNSYEVFQMYKESSCNCLIITTTGYDFKQVERYVRILSKLPKTTIFFNDIYYFLYLDYVYDAYNNKYNQLKSQFEDYDSFCVNIKETLKKHDIYQFRFNFCRPIPEPCDVPEDIHNEFLPNKYKNISDYDYIQYIKTTNNNLSSLDTGYISETERFRVKIYEKLNVDTDSMEELIDKVDKLKGILT